MSLQTHNFNNADLDCFRQYQRRSFETLIEVGQTLKAGDTEILVITGNGAEWLDEDLPHTRFWEGAPMLGVPVGEASSAGYDRISCRTGSIVSSEAALSYNNISPKRGPI